MRRANSTTRCPCMEAELAMLLRLGASEEHMLAMQSNLAMSYEQLGKHEQTLRMRQDVYFGRLKLSARSMYEPSSSQQLRVLPCASEGNPKKPRH